MATNRTARTVTKLEADGEGLWHGLRAIGATLGPRHCTEPVVRAELDSLKASSSAFGQAQSDETRASQAAQAADDANGLFIQQFVYWMSMIWGGKWSGKWIATGLPDNVVGVPRTEAKRFVLMGSIAAFLTDHPEYELNHGQVVVTAARAQGLQEAYTAARREALHRRGMAASAKMTRDSAFRAFRRRYRWAIRELGEDLSGDDPRWALFRLRAPDAPETPEAPQKVSAVASGAGRILVNTSWPRRAHSLNYYRKIVGTDAEPVKVENFREKELMIENLPVGATVEVTVRGVNDAGEGRACDAVSVVVA